MDDVKKELLKKLPKIDEVLLILEKHHIYDLAERYIVKDTCRKVVQNFREKIMHAKKIQPSQSFPDAAGIAHEVKREIKGLYNYSLRRLVNATGVILHTNLGRAPLCPEALQRIIEVGRGYSNLEFDLMKGERGHRYDHVSSLICALTGAEDALIVNNNAAAVFLVLNTLAEGKEAIVSRGELIEIGGEFRIPEIMEKSGGRLREVGTTNRTRLSDYEKAVNADTALILKVHTSNFRIVGFTEEADIGSLAALGKRRGIPVVDDLGSGCLVDLDLYGLEHEPTVRETLAAGADVVTFSGDKLLGGPQAGIIAGKKDLLGKIKANPLNRALRIDKFTLAALEGTLMHYLAPNAATRKLRPLTSLTESVTALKKQALELMALLHKEKFTSLQFSIHEDFAAAGGGSLPTQKIPTILISIKSNQITADKMEEKLRKLEVPIIVRVDKDEILIDLRTVTEDEFGFVIDGLKQITAG
ncbi:MAG: L-seryl-tRNA(Sec) selenium transferase [Smithella sp.]